MGLADGESTIIRNFLATVGLAVSLALSGASAHAQSIKIGLVLTLSGPPAVIGQHAATAFSSASSISAASWVGSLPM